MEELSEEQIEEFKEAFSLFDPEGNGYIQTKELGTVLRSLGIHTTDDEKNEFIEKYDPNSESVIYFKDFLEILITKIAETKPDDELQEAFKLFDQDKKHYLEVDAFKNDLNNYCPGIDQSEIIDICDFLKTDNNIIKIEEAVQRLFSKIKPHLN
jgi:calmodulin